VTARLPTDERGAVIGRDAVGLQREAGREHAGAGFCWRLPTFLSVPTRCRLLPMANAGSDTDFTSAALRHIRDAEHLVAAGEHTSRDQAWHLAGFAHECARKACLRDRWLPKVLGHAFDQASEDVIELAIALDPRAGRMPVRNWSTDFPAIDSWRPDHRYEATGAANEAGRDVAALVEQGRRAVNATVIALLFEGTLAPGALR